MNSDLPAWANIGKLTCAQCGGLFDGTLRQVKRVKYENAPVYCSPLCRTVAVTSRMLKPLPVRGACRNCGKMFASRTSKLFCGIDCYLASDQMKAMSAASSLAAARKAQKRIRDDFIKQNSVKCPQCNEMFYSKPSSKRKYCTTECRRLFFEARFDRWIASSERIGDMSNFDEFLTKDELPCLVEGCEWIGQHLSIHMNQAHGLRASDFKRVAGFNQGTGVIALPLHRVFCERENSNLSFLTKGNGRIGGAKGPGSSKEHRERWKKSRALISATTTGPERICVGCGSTFVQSTPFGKALFCDPDCRDTYRRENPKLTELHCSRCNKAFPGNPPQRIRSEKSLPVYCSSFCRQSANGAQQKAGKVTGATKAMPENADVEE